MRSSRFRTIAWLLIAGFLVGGGLVVSLNAAYATSPRQETAPTPDPLTIGDDVCLGCHEQPGQSMPLENGELLDLTVYPEEYAASIHGKLGYACVQCHRTVGNYPHPPETAASLREFTIQMNKTCSTCHEPEALLTQDSVHATALASGQREAAVCTDCHGSHNIERWTDPDSGELTQEARLRIPQACANCHSEIYEKYTESVHGAALYEENNTDVPTCIDCHGVHNIEDPTTAEFRLASPKTCAECHTNEEIMQKYGLSTDVLDTYVADFHGTTVAVFNKLSPDAETNKPVCYDCHGIHDISRTSDPEHGLQLQENLLTRCQTCHPDASTNFPTAWLSHYIPSSEQNQLVYYVELFYKFFIPMVLVPMILLVGLDVGHTVYKKAHKRVKQAAPLPPAAEQTAEVSAVAEEAAAVEEIATDQPAEASTEPSDPLTAASEQPPTEPEDDHTEEEANHE
jgi:nitrate/TMAO reductase-like tetraheme cytochrome c subunit